MDILQIVLRLFHVIGGIFWVGVILFNAFFLGPAVREAGPDGGKLMAILVKRKLTVVMPIIGLLTIVSGVWLFYRASVGFSPEYMRSRHGMVYSLGGASAILALIIGGAVLAPALDKMGRLGAQMAQASEGDRARLGAEMGALRGRLGVAGNLIASFAIVTAICMAIGRYV